jgi:uncharacterized membrane protein
MAALASNAPFLAEWVDIGDSWDKITPGGAPGYDLYALILTNRLIHGPKPKFFLMAEIHAREFTTAETAARFAEYLVSNYGIDPDITWLLDYFEIHIVPMTNPDGRKIAEGGQFWRKNTDNDDGCYDSASWGTDLNRNHSFHWGSAGTQPCNEIYQGPALASEPETQSIQNYVLSLYPDRRGAGDNDPAPDDATGVFITLHSYGSLVLFPWGWSPDPSPNRTDLETLGRKFGYYNNYRVCQSGEPGCIYATTGTSDDWAYGTLGVAAYTFEMGTEFFQDCSYYTDILWPQNQLALLYAFKAARRPYQNPAGPESISVNVTPSTVIAGNPVTLTATADDTRYNSNGWGIEPIQNITTAYYTIDFPSWYTGTVESSMIASDGAFDGSVESVQATLNSAGLIPGRHTIFVESQDDVGNRGVPGATFFCVAEAEHAVSLNPYAASSQADPGQVVSYALRVTNAGAIADTYQVSVRGNKWTTAYPLTVGPLPACGSKDMIVAVHVPMDLNHGVTDVVTITLASPEGNSATGVLTTTANAASIIETLQTAYASGAPGAFVIYTLPVTNAGNITDTFSITARNASWQTIAPVTQAPLAAQASTNLMVSVTVPITAAGGESDTADIMLASKRPSVQPVTVTLTTTASNIYGLSLDVPVAERIGFPGFSVTYLLELTNTGNTADFYDVVITSTWGVSFETPIGLLARGGTRTLPVIVTIPSDVLSGVSDTAMVTIISRGDPRKTSMASLTTTVRWFNMLLPLIAR